MSLPRPAIVGFMAAILLVGLIRFTLTASGVADEAARYASMTAVILAACAYFGLLALSWKQLAVLAYLLILPYMAVELAALGYTWATGKATIFHAPQYSFGVPIAPHFWGHLIGGLTWEPLALLVVMLIVRAVARRLAAAGAV